ncbi:HmuY family protein [Porphyromonas sp. COT-290 OH3588]|uniref:HmuY family protein n=1 Tax=Porphyromonas sp. COT-290 OH3588 TaxID=1515617 RepID=UPI000694F545|nr:HmuY family protein [Porphyromonas sp. COT-290 OH3588]
MKKLFLSLALVATGVFAVSCDKKKDEPKKQTTMKEVSIDATDYGKWMYFSLEQGKLVEVADPMNSNEWDLGFHFTDIRTNSGASGKGQGGAFATDLKEVTDELKTLPNASDFVVDKETKIITQTHNEKGEHDIKQEKGGANPLLTTFQTVKIGSDGKPELGPNGLPIFIKGTLGAIDFSHGRGGAKFTLSNKVYLIRTAKGKFVKIKIVDYRNAHAKTVHVKMQYAPHQ